MSKCFVTIVFSALVICVSAGHDHAQYNFEYEVNDPHTNDIKSQYEHRVGQHVTGVYTLKEADGTRRIVKYKSDPHTGFEAVVEKIGQAYHPAQFVQGHGQGHGSGFGEATSHVGTTLWSNQCPQEYGHY